MDHSQLVAELSELEKMTAQQRIELARQRREDQLSLWREHERILPPPPPRRPRLQFIPEVALLEATVRGDYQEVERLLMAGVDPDSHNEDLLTPLHQCAIDNNESIVQLLLRYGASINSKDAELWTPLHAAACCGYIGIVRLLIMNHADLLAVNADGNMPYDICDDEATLDLIESEMANQGITQERIDEMRAHTEKSMLDDMKLLKQHGYPLDIRMNEGFTYLHVAAANGFYDVAAFLLKCGLSPSVRDYDLWMPVHAAANWNHPDIIELLYEYGSEINAKTNTGEFPLDLAEDDQTKQLIQTLAQNEEKRKKRSAYGVRDSRRQSKRRKKFESPHQLPPPTDNPFSARGAIRRQSLRDKNGMTPARLEAQKENYALIRSWSKEDVSSTKFENVSSLPFVSSAQPSTSANSRLNNNRESPKRNIVNKHQQKTKLASNDSWFRKLEVEKPGYDEDDDGFSSLHPGHNGRGQIDKDSSLVNEGTTLNGSGVGGIKHDNIPLNRHKKRCCCIIC